MSAAERLRLHIVDKCKDVGWVSVPLIRQSRDLSPQYIGRILNQMADEHKLKRLGKFNNTQYFVFPQSRKTLEDVERLVTSRELIAQAWMGVMRTPQEFITLLDKKKQSTARKLFDSDNSDYLDYFTQILPAVETLCYGRRANTQADIDLARATVSLYLERLQSVTEFLRRTLENEHIRTGAFAEALSDYAINNYRSSYTREEAS